MKSDQKSQKNRKKQNFLSILLGKIKIFSLFWGSSPSPVRASPVRKANDTNAIALSVSAQVY